MFCIGEKGRREWCRKKTPASVYIYIYSSKKWMVDVKVEDPALRVIDTPIPFSLPKLHHPSSFPSHPP